MTSVSFFSALRKLVLRNDIGVSRINQLLTKDTRSHMPNLDILLALESQADLCFLDLKRELAGLKTQFSIFAYGLPLPPPTSKLSFLGI